jgi:hypothetical protein
MPVTTPLAAIVATEGLLLDHVPPAVVLARVIVASTQTVVGPVMAFTVGFAFTVTV